MTLYRWLPLLIRWSKQWEMRFNAAKCKVIRTTGCIKCHHFYRMDGQILQEVQKATYLGVTLCCDLTWSENIQAVASKANRMLGFARRNLLGSPKCCKSTHLTSKIRYGICIHDMGPLPEEKHWSSQEGTTENSTMGLLSLQVHHQCDQTPQRSKLETIGRLKIEPKTNLIP